jgi:tetratricopeptide (TPR) repeat protein
MCSVATNAQSTKEKARAMFKNGEYAEAKPLFESLLKRSPKDGSYNFWYAACCLETNDTVADIEKMLRYAVTRRVNEAHRYLGDFYKRDYRYDEAVACYEVYIDGCNDDDVIATYDIEAEYQLTFELWSRYTFIVIVDKTNRIYATRTYETPMNLPETFVHLHLYAWRQSGAANGWDVTNPFPDEVREPLVPAEEEEVNANE